MFICLFLSVGMQVRMRYEHKTSEPNKVAKKLTQVVLSLNYTVS